MTKWQVVHGSEVSSSLRGFGFSLSGGVDLDSNQYPDLVVGAAHSNQAVLLRSVLQPAILVHKCVPACWQVPACSGPAGRGLLPGGVGGETGHR